MAGPLRTARATVAAAIALMGVLAVGLSVLTAEICRRGALADQRDAIAELVGLAADEQLGHLGANARELGLTLQSEPRFRRALAAGDANALSTLLDSHFHQYFVTAGVIGLEKLVVYDAALVPVADSHEGIATSARTFCPRVVTEAAQRQGPERLKILSGLCLQGGRPLHVTLVPVGGLLPMGYVEVVTDPLQALKGVGTALGLPVELRGTDGGMVAREGAWPAAGRRRSALVATHTLRGQAGEPVVTVAVVRDVRELLDRFARTRGIAVAVAGLASLVMGVVAVLTLKSAVVDPIRALCRHVRAVRDNRDWLSRPVPVGGSREARELAAAFNDMAASLDTLYADISTTNRSLRREVAEKERAQGLLKAATDDLERRVAERTASLRRANEHLKAQARDRRQAELALVGARDEAESAGRAKSAFLSGMNHRLRTPLNAMVGFAELLDGPGGDGLSPRQRDWVRQIREAGAALRELVDQVLDLARVESDRIAITPIPVDLVPLLAECVEAVRPRARAREIDGPTVTAPPGPVGVRADPERLRRVLGALLTNAVDYNRRRGTVTVAVEPRGEERVRVTVADTGHGIPPSRQAQVFEAFAAAESREGGAGVNLALSRRVMELMGGAVGLESTPGRGSRFWVELPAAPVPTPSQFFAARTGTAQAPGAGGPLLLCVEDDPASRTLLEELVRRNLPGAELLTAPSAEQGLELARERRPDAILMDLRLPGMDGLAAVAALKADPATAAIPVVAVSADARPPEEAAARAAGCTGFVAKPYRFADLLARLEDALAPAGGAPPESPDPADPAESAS